MRKTLSRILGLSALLALLPACSPQSDVEEATLDLSTETLTFTKEASEQTLTVSTNKEKLVRPLPTGSHLAKPHAGGQYSEGPC